MQENEIKVVTNNADTKTETEKVETMDTDTLIEVLWTKNRRLQCLA